MRQAFTYVVLLFSPVKNVFTFFVILGQICSFFCDSCLEATAVRYFFLSFLKALR